MKLHDELESPVLKQLNNIWLDGIFRCKRCATLMKEPSTSSWSTTKVCMNLRWCMFWHKVLQEEHMGGDSKIVPKWLQVGQMYLEKRSIFHNFTVRLHKFFLLGGYYFLDKPLHIFPETSLENLRKCRVFGCRQALLPWRGRNGRGCSCWSLDCHLWCTQMIQHELFWPAWNWWRPPDWNWSGHRHWIIEY